MQNRIFARIYAKIPFRPLARLLSLAAGALLILRMLTGCRRKPAPPAQDAAEARTLALAALEPIGSALRRQPVRRKRLPNDPTVALSLIIPVYNAVRTLPKLLASVLPGIPGEVLELVCVNDGSTDDSAAILRQFQAEHGSGGLRVVILGQANAGVAAARGEYLAFADADDYLAPGYLFRLLARARASQADLTESGALLARPEGQVSLKAGWSNPFVRDLTKDPSFALELSGVPWARLYRRELFDGLWFPEGYDYEDTLIAFAVLRRAARWAFEPAAVYVHTSTGQSITAALQASPKCLDSYFVVERLLDDQTVPRDSILYRMLVAQFGAMFRQRLARLPRDLRQAALLLARDLLCAHAELRPRRLPPYERLTEAAVLAGNLEPWEWVTRY
ncbi:MAG: glycosyltransferase [Oscillospiraceae bacterium]|jgi:glycosyltransferase involved in cell wall biosynthesis|nr:glycosyltransferase [Oscillospiraceae bacterium]